MKRWIVVAALAALPLVGLPLGASAQPALNETQLSGMALFNQHCRVCHAKPQLSSPMYGPVLSQKSLNGQDTMMKNVITNGSPRMPAFKYTFAPAQIDSIVAYLKTVPAPTP
jgi:mono/diheme cytochrome c family protein